MQKSFLRDRTTARARRAKRFPSRAAARPQLLVVGNRKIFRSSEAALQPVAKPMGPNAHFWLPADEWLSGSDEWLFCLGMKDRLLPSRRGAGGQHEPIDPHWRERLMNAQRTQCSDSKRRLSQVSRPVISFESWTGSPSRPRGIAAKLGYLAAEESGAEGSRTPDLCIANAALSQLSYRPNRA